MEKIRLLIVDDIAQTRTDLQRLLYFEEDLEVVGEAANGEEAIAKVAEPVSYTHLIYELMEYGASAYILKDTTAEELLNVIRIVASGDTYIDPRMTGKLIGAWRYKSEGFNIKDKLTERELEILAEVAAGANNKAIAEKLFLSEKTVKNHITSILRKLKVNDRTQAAIYAIKHNLVDI